MQISEDNLREEDRVVSASIVDKRKTIMIDDSESDDNGQVASIDILVEQNGLPASRLADVYTTTKTSAINSLWPLFVLLC